jgi:hypothetical protein
MKKRQILSVLMMIILLGTMAAGCSWFRSETKPLPTKQIIQPSARLLTYLPKTVGTKWTYFGMAEYSHTMTLQAVVRSPRQTVFRVMGKVADMSGGASKKNFNFQLEYTVNKDAIYEKVVQSDTPFPHQLKLLKLLALPIKKGTTWTQPIVINSKPAIVKAQILEVKMDNTLKRERVKVVYRVPMKGMPKGIYEETREFLSGVGVYSFEKTFGPKLTDRFNYRLRKFEIPRQGVVNFQ